MSRVLIAEDDPGSRELLAEVLNALGYDVVSTADGQEALEKLEEACPDLILLDLQMPRMDGLATIQRIRENPRFSDLPVFAVTAYAMKGDRERALEKEFNGYFSKPIDPLSLQSNIAHAIAMHRTSRAKEAGTGCA